MPRDNLFVWGGVSCKFSQDAFNVASPKTLGKGNFVHKYRFVSNNMVGDVEVRNILPFTGLRC